MRDSIFAAQLAQSRLSIRYVLVTKDAARRVRGSSFTSGSMEAQISCIRDSRESGLAAATRSCFVAKVMVASATPGSF